jgi:hypothetical protein
MRKAYFSGVLAVVATLLVAAPTAVADETSCVGALPPGTYEDIVVPPGQFCFLQDSQVRGNVVVRREAFLFGQRNTVQGNVTGVEEEGSISLFDRNRVLGNVSAVDDAFLNVLDSWVDGNVEGDKALVVDVLRSVVGGNITAREGTGGFARVCGTVVENGNIQVTKLSDSGVLIGDDFFCGFGFGGGNEVRKGNIQAAENLIAPAFRTLGIDQNTVPQGNLQVLKNRGDSEKTVQFNTVGKNLQCFENTPPFVGTPNTAGKHEGQCAP